MSAERMPQAEVSLLEWPLRWITALVVRFPMPVLALAVALAVFSIVASMGDLGFRTSRLDLINPDSSYNRLWLDYINEFGDSDDVVVVVEGPDRETVVPVLEELSAALSRENRLFQAVLHEVDLSKVRNKGLHYLPHEELLSIEQFLDKAEPIVRGQWGRLKLGSMADAMSARLADAAQSGDPVYRAAVHDELDRMSKSLLAALGQREQYQSPWPEMPGSVATLSELSSEYLLTSEGRMGFVLLRLVKDDRQSLAQGSGAIDALRGLIARIQAGHPETAIGLTGLPVMENDEMRSSQVAMNKASLLSLFGVACLFVAGFGGLRHPLMAVAALLLALAWTLGYITLAVGHLNILSISFGVILIGLGIDFGVHYVARYLQIRREVHSAKEALIATATSVGPGIVTGAVTTAIAFYMAGFTEFTGVAELGLIAGGGILLCCFAAMVVLPAMIHLSDAKRVRQTVPAPLDIHGWLRPLLARPALLLFAAVAGTLALSLSGVARFRETGWYDHNLLNLQAEGLESVELVRKLVAKNDQRVWFAISVAGSREELLERKQRFSQLPSVQRVEEIASLIPADNSASQAVVAHIHRRLADLPERPPQISIDSPEQVGRMLAQAQALLADSPATARTQRQLEQVREILRRMPLDECYRRISDYQHYLAGDLLSRLHILGAISNPEPPCWSDLPEGLVTRFVAQDGSKHLLKIFAKADIWDMDAMEQFVREVRSVDERVTGNPLQTYEASREMQSSYVQAAWYALACILIVLYLDFRSLTYTLLALLPLGLGMVQMFGVLGLLGVPLNPANMIVLPLILGIGIDDGVHVLHDFRSSRGRYRLSASTANAVLITSLTTMVGFGSLMIASHQGLQSLGRVLTIGVSCCLFSSLVILPAILVWATWNRADEGETEPEASTSASGGGRIRRFDPAHFPGTSPAASVQPAHSTEKTVQHR